MNAARKQQSASESAPKPKQKKSNSGLPAPVIGPRDLTAVREARKQKAENAGDDFSKNFLVCASPHIHNGETTRTIMGDVLFALLPAAIASVFFFGWRSLITILVCVVSCVATEAVCRVIMKRRQTISDLSAAVTGVILAFCLPPEINPLFCVIGSIVAIAVVKQMFGGIGMNFANPAATARIVLMLSFPVAMTTYSVPFSWWDKANYDAVSTATPLAQLADPASGTCTNLELLLGFHGGCLGETCAIALLVGGLFLLLRGIITWEIPVSFLGTVAVISLIAGQDPIYQLLSGGVMLGAIFMATDYATSPVNSRGKLIYGVGCGLLTMLIRLFGSMTEGVSFAILLMNIITPHIDNLTLNRAFGEERDAA
ncbi:MAG: RnfABCDGE type electron transport complex subunit D [Ruminococcaceae bacterium]|nr:RnfABCDGE type electron transport complex subunit D [Oscillospiraceae bacterium]